MQKTWKYGVYGVVGTFSLIGFVLTLGYLATRLGLTDTKGIIDTQRDSFLVHTTGMYGIFPLSHKEEWISFRLAVARDKDVIDRVSKETGVPARLLVTILVPEQMRLFYSNRDLFKQVFAPLKVLGSQSQFSWGIFGIKDETARAVENNLKDPSSPYYLGKASENKLAFTTDNPDEERFQRIIDEHDHYYSYLYAALYIKEIEKQWRDKGYPIDNDPGIIATLWNLGFDKSKPHKDPRSGGSEMEIDGTTYSFGRLANDFYYSDELIELYPVK